MNCGPLLFLIFLGLCALGVGAAVAHELLTRWRYDQALRTLIEGETVIEWPVTRSPIKRVKLADGSAWCVKQPREKQ